MAILGTPRLLAIVLVVCCFLSTFYMFYKHHQARSHDIIESHIDKVRNSTLGFQKVFIVNMPDRPDKLDQFTVMSSLTGFAIDVIQGVKGADVPKKSLPSLERLEEKLGPIGAWRAHLDFARTVVTAGLATALVMEDDADWDVNLKDQLQMFALGSQWVTGVPTGHKPHSPYGDDWDLLWLGHCASRIQPNDQRRWVIENDATAPATRHRGNFGPYPNMSELGYDDSTRIIYRAIDCTCSYAYALSYRGARKVLHTQNHRGNLKPMDIALGEMCGTPNFKCISVFPQLIDSHKWEGRINRDSDISDIKDGGSRAKGYTFNIVHSLALNMERLLAEDGSPVERQFPEDPEVVGPPQQRSEVRVED